MAVSAHTEEKSWYDRRSCNLTNTNLLTIRKALHLDCGSSAFLHFELSSTQDIGTAYTEMYHKSKKPLIFKDFRLIFNDKKKTVGRYYPYQSTVPYLCCTANLDAAAKRSIKSRNFGCFMCTFNGSRWLFYLHKYSAATLPNSSSPFAL